MPIEQSFYVACEGEMILSVSHPIMSVKILRVEVYWDY